jgi:hypothetical protein
MDAVLRHKLLAYLGGAAIAFSSGSAEAARSDLAMIPEPIMEEFLEDVDNDEWRPADFFSLAELLAGDPRSKIRYLIAELFTRIRSDLLNGDLEPVLAKLAKDKDPLVQSTLTRSITSWLSHLDELDRARVVLEWALSDDAPVRQAIAAAISHGVSALWVDFAVEHLSEDESSDVRAAVVEAAQNRFHENPALYFEILGRLCSDETRSIKRSARRATARLSRPA